MIKKIMIIFSMTCLLICSASGDSLFMASDPVMGSIFTDRRARSIGDIITVIISENSTTSYNEQTSLKKKSSLEAQIKSLFYSIAAAPTQGTDALYQNMTYTGSRTGSHRGVMPDTAFD